VRISSGTGFRNADNDYWIYQQPVFNQENFVIIATKPAVQQVKFRAIMPRLLAG